MQNIKRGILFLAVATLLAPGLSLAQSIIDLSPGSLGGMFKDTESGKTWLDFDVFIDRSFEDTRSSLVGSGFRFATKAEVQELFDNVDDLLLDALGGSRRCSIGFSCIDAYFNDSTSGTDNALVGKAGAFFTFSSSMYSENIADDASTGNASPFVGAWIIQAPPTLCSSSQRYGLDMDCDGVDENIIWRKTTGTWYIRLSASGDALVHQWGLQGDIPILGDYTGDGIPDLVVWRPTDGNWYIKTSESNFDTAAAITRQFGLPGDKPLRGDFDGDGLLDSAVWRPSTGLRYYLSSSNQEIIVSQWGLAGDLPITAGTAE